MHTGKPRYRSGFKKTRALEIRKSVKLAADIVAEIGSVRSEKSPFGFIGSWESCIPKIKVLSQEIIEL